jgi:hypothetical protein
MTTSSPESQFAPESGQNSHQTGDFERTWEDAPTNNLSDIQIRAIELTVQGYTDTQTAQFLSINRRTLYEWKKHNEEYREVLAEAREQMHASVTDRYENIVFKATSTLVKFLDDPTDASRMKAAQILLNIASRYKPIPEKRRPELTQKEIDNYYFPPPDLGPKVG